jgi:hypothetical protein
MTTAGKFNMPVCCLISLIALFADREHHTKQQGEMGMSYPQAFLYFPQSF